MKNKLFVCLLILLSVFCLTGCGKKEEEKKKTEKYIKRTLMCNGYSDNMRINAYFSEKEKSVSGSLNVELEFAEGTSEEEMNSVDMCNETMMTSLIKKGSCNTHIIQNRLVADLHIFGSGIFKGTKKLTLEEIKTTIEDGYADMKVDCSINE